MKKNSRGELYPETAADFKRISDQSPFTILEAYKTVRTNLLFALSSRDSKTIVISSPSPAEGKSTTCCNLSITMAQTGAKILLIDGDMRKPVQHKIFKKPNLRGLSNLLGGFFTLDEVRFEDVVPGLDLITAGTIPPNPSELMGSENMKLFLQQMEGRYDYIFVDTPPLNVVTDAVVLARAAAGVVLVARHGRCTYDELDKAVASVQFSGADILGVVINGVGDKPGGHRQRKNTYYQQSYATSGE